MAQMTLNPFDAKHAAVQAPSLPNPIIESFFMIYLYILNYLITELFQPDPLSIYKLFPVLFLNASSVCISYYFSISMPL
jgi:hypothetical protein